MIGPIAEGSGKRHSLLIRPPFCLFIWLAWGRLLGIATGSPIQNFDPFQQAVERRFLRPCKTWSYLRAYSHIDLALYSL